MEGLEAALGCIEKELTEAAELHLTGDLSEPLYKALVRGSVSSLPKPMAPHHIKVLM